MNNIDEAVFFGKYILVEYCKNIASPMGPCFFLTITLINKDMMVFLKNCKYRFVEK